VKRVRKSAKWDKLRIDQFWAKKNIRSAIGAEIPDKES